MILLWPWFLLFLLIIPLFIAIYLWILRRKRRYAVRYSSLALIKEALPKRPGWRRHLPFALFLLALISLIMAMTRPAVAMEVPLSRTTIILALDVSLSMCSTDVAPNRLTAAQEAALAFIEDQPGDTQIGIVAFAGLAELVIPPTNDKEALEEAINGLTASFGTAIGNATLKSIDAISEINPSVPPSGLNLQLEGTGEEIELTGYQPDIIVLLTDGANTMGPLPLNAAQQAADRDIRVYTIGFGSNELQPLICSREQLGGDVLQDGIPRVLRGNFSGGGGGGGSDDIRRYVLLDEDTLEGVANMTGGTYFRAENAEELLEVFLNLPSQIILQNQTVEISFIFVIFAIIFALVAIMLSLKWNRYP